MSTPQNPQVAERETMTLTSPLGKEVKIKTYLTGREKRAIRNAYTSQLKSVTDEHGKTHYEIASGTEAIMASEDALLRAAVVSYDGKTENVLEAILDAPDKELNFIQAECNKLSQDPK